MKRLEIFANKSVQDDLVQRIGAELTDFFFTLIPLAYGAGSCGPRMGTAVWPEENCVIIIYDREERIGRVKKIVDAVKKEFPREGVRYFELP